MRVVLEAVRVQVLPCLLGHAGIGSAQHSVFMPDQRDDLAGLGWDVKQGRFGLYQGVAVYVDQRPPVVGQEASGDRGGSPQRVARDLDAVGLDHTVEVVWLEAVGSEGRDEELVAVLGAVDDAEPLSGGAVELRVVAEDELGECPAGEAVVPELFLEGELVAVGGVLAIFAGPGAGQTGGEGGGEGGQVCAVKGHGLPGAEGVGKAWCGRCRARRLVRCVLLELVQCRARSGGASVD